MGRLEDLTRGATIRGILPVGAVTVVDVEWFGDAAVELTDKDAAGRPGNQLVYRDDEPSFEIVAAGRPWSFDGDGELLRLVSEAHRIRLAYLSGLSRRFLLLTAAPHNGEEPDFGASRRLAEHRRTRRRPPLTRAAGPVCLHGALPRRYPLAVEDRYTSRHERCP